MASYSSDLIVSVSGIRGIVGTSLTPDVACRFAMALGSSLSKKHVVVARDSRPSGIMLRNAVTAGLTAAGCKVSDIGIAPTPSVGIAVRHLEAGGAIQITASHNPSPWNGLKMFGPQGAVLSATEGARVVERFQSGDFTLADWQGIGTVGAPPELLAEHERLVLDQVSVATIATGRFRVFLDANGGAGGPLGSNLLHALGCEVVAHNCDPNGIFDHEPEPTPDHLQGVAPWVQQSESSVGFVLDPDADRLALIDETGQCLSEELTLALAVKYRLRQERGPVVVNMSTSRVIEDITREAGCEFFRSAVGEANVVEKMRATQAVIGGEGNGGVIDPRVGWVRDPFIGMSLILGLMAEEQKPISRLAAELPAYTMLKTKATLDRSLMAQRLPRLADHWPDAKVNDLDGIRLDGPNWWLHVRPSNTEPIVRIIAEAPTADEAAALCAEARTLLEE